MSEPRRPILVYLTDEELAALQTKAAQEGHTLSTMVRALLRRALGL